MTKARYTVVHGKKRVSPRQVTHQPERLQYAYTFSNAQGLHNRGKLSIENIAKAYSFVEWKFNYLSYMTFYINRVQCFLRLGAYYYFTCRCAPLSIASSENHEIRTRVQETKFLHCYEVLDHSRSYIPGTVSTSVPIRSPQLLPNGTMNTAVANRPHRRARRGITYVRVGPGPQPLPLRLHLLLLRRPAAASEAAKSSFFGGSFAMAKTSPLGSSSSSSSSSSSCAEPDKDLALAPVFDPPPQSSTPKTTKRRNPSVLSAIPRTMTWINQ